MYSEYTLKIKSKNGVKEIYFDFSKSDRRAAISLLNNILKAIEEYKRESTSSRGSTGGGVAMPKREATFQKRIDQLTREKHELLRTIEQLLKEREDKAEFCSKCSPPRKAARPENY